MKKVSLHGLVVINLFHVLIDWELSHEGQCGWKGDFHCRSMTEQSRIVKHTMHGWALKRVLWHDQLITFLCFYAYYTWILNMSEEISKVFLLPRVLIELQFLWVGAWMGIILIDWEKNSEELHLGMHVHTVNPQQCTWRKRKWLGRISCNFCRMKDFFPHQQRWKSTISHGITSSQKIVRVKGMK